MPKTVLELKTNAFLLNDLFKESNHYKESIVRDIFYFTLNKPIYIPSIYKLSSNGQYVYHGEKRAYPFYVFSDFVNDEKLKQQLQTMERTKKCHDFALQFTLGEECYKIVTGYVNLFNKNLLHSVLKTYFPILKKNVYLDFTYNIIMDCKTYEDLFSFKKVETLTHEDMIEFEENLYLLFDAYEEKFAVCFAKELTRDLKRVKKTFDK